MDHTSRSFDSELANLRSSVDSLGEAVFALVDDALFFLISQDRQDTGETYRQMELLHHRVESQILGILALRSPVADDLRLVVATLKLASFLKRAGQHAESMATKNMHLEQIPTHRATPALRRLGEEVLGMLRKVVKSYGDQDAGSAMEVWHYDRLVDERHASLFRELLTYMMEDPSNIAVCIDLIFIAKDIERIGDYATNIAEMVYYLVTGNNFEGDRPKGDTAATDREVVA